MIRIDTNVRVASRKVEEIGRKLEDELDDLVQAAAAILAQQSAQNVREQGGTFGRKWKPASKWIDAKKGYGAKLFDGQDRRIRSYAAGRHIANVAFFSPGEWTLTQHHQGFTIPATGEDVTLHNLKSPGALGLPAGRTSYKFNWKNDSKVPGRGIWPTEQQARNIVGIESSKWITLVANRLV